MTAKQHVTGLTDLELSLLLWDIEVSGWNFDDQQRDPVHEIVRPIDLIDEAAKRLRRYGEMKR